MIRFKILSGNKACIMCDGKTYIFSRTGVCEEEDAGMLSKYIDNMLNLPILSILTANGKLEILACYTDDTTKKFTATSDMYDVIRKFEGNRSIVRVLRRVGMAEGIKYNQLIFVYREGTDLDGVINGVGGLKEV